MLLYFGVTGIQHLKLFPGSTCQVFTRMKFPHTPGKLPKITLQIKRNFYHFHRLPFIRRLEYIDLIPTCSYSPSFLVRGKLKRFQGIRRTNVSRVFPPDDTDMYKNVFKKHDWKKPNTFVEKVRVESVVDKLMNSLRSR